MKLARALLISSINQASAWEGTSYRLFGLHLLSKRYRFRVTDQRLSNERLLFEIFCVSQEQYQDPKMPQGRLSSRDVVADLPHVSKSFADLGVLHNFLHRFQINLENWSPVEPE